MYDDVFHEIVVFCVETFIDDDSVTAFPRSLPLSSLSISIGFDLHYGDYHDYGVWFNPVIYSINRLILLLVFKFHFDSRLFRSVGQTPSMSGLSVFWRCWL